MKRMTKRIVSIVLALSLVLGMTATAFAAPAKVTEEQFNQKVEELCGMLEDYYFAVDAEAQAALDAVIAEVEAAEADLAAAKAELEKFIAEQNAELNKVVDDFVVQINELEAYLDELKAQTEADLANPDSDLSKKIAEVEAAIDAMEARLAEIAAEEEALIAAGEKALAAIEALAEIGATNNGADKTAAVNALKEAVADVADVVYEMKPIVADLQAAIEVAIEEAAVLSAVAEELIEVAKAEIEEMAPVVKAEIEKTIADIEAALDAIDAAIVEFNAAVEAFNAEVEAAIADAIATVEAFIADAIAAVEAAIEAATTCDYEITKDSYYVALGDAAAKAYAELLAADLGVATKNLSKAGMTAEELFAVIDANKAEIEKADLITLGLGNAEILEFVLNQVADPAELDWSKYVGAENTAYVEEALAAMADELAAQGITGEAADMLIDAVEAYAYAYTTLLCNYPEAVNAIKAINPEAQVIIVGMYNPLAGLVVDVNGTEVAVGDYVDYVIAASNAHYFGYALLTGNAIYVDAPDVAIGLEDKVYGIEDLMALLMDTSALYPTEAGYAYIAEQILNAMNITKAVLGDADGNGKVLANDAMLVLQYSTNIINANALDLSVCDVDGNGKVLANDAMLILQYSTNVITKFPVE